MNLKELRIEKGLKQKEIAEKLSRTITCISDWERGRTEPSIDDLIKLSKILNVNIETIIGVEEKNIKNIETLSYKEKKLLKLFFLLDEEEKDKIIDDCEYFANKKTKEKSRRV